MKIEQIDVGATIEEATSIFENETNIPPAFRSVFKLKGLMSALLPSDLKEKRSGENDLKDDKGSSEDHRMFSIPLKVLLFSVESEAIFLLVEKMVSPQMKH